MSLKVRHLLKSQIILLLPGDQKGLFKLAVQLRKFYILVIYNTATGYVLLVYLTNI
jgi:membrane-bound lytic murein transglycosylase B